MLLQDEFRWTVEEYLRLGEAGVLTNSKVKLVDGEILEVPAQAHEHRLSVSKISRLLNAALVLPRHSENVTPGRRSGWHYAAVTRHDRGGVAE